MKCDGKVIFSTKAAAMGHASKSFNRRDSNTNFYRAYGCVKCHGWHLTSKPKHGTGTKTG